MTHEDGSFKLRLSKDETTIHATAGNLIGTAPPSDGVTITLAGGRTITGSLRDESRRPIAGARVAVQEAGDTYNWKTTAVDAKGEFAITPLAPGNYTIYLEVPEEYVVESKQADLRKKSESRADFLARKSEAIRGVVRDEDGHRVAGAVVTQPIEMMPLLYAGTTTYVPHAISAPDGSFRLYAVEPKGKLTAIKAGFAAGLSDPLTPASARKQVTITLPRGITVKGFVFGPDDKPLSGASVIVMSSASTLGTMPIAASLASGMLDEWVHTDANGTFSVQLNAGAHDFGVWKRGFASREVGGIEVSSSMDPVRVVLEPAVSIRGRVVRKGAPVDGGAVIAIEQSQMAVGQARLGSNGEFVIDSLQRGNYSLQYVDTNVRTRATKLSEAPAAGVVIELPELVEVHGRVTDGATGAPIHEFKVTVRGGESYDTNDVDDPNGEFAQSVNAGETELRISAAGYRTATRTVLTAEGKETPPLTFALVKGRRISGRVVSKEGKPVAEVRVSIDRQRGESEGATTDDEGEFVLESAPLEAFELTTYKEGFVSTKKKVAAGADSVVEITIDSGLKVSGRVVDKSGAPVEDADVSVTGEGNYESAKTDKSGVFTISGLEPGIVAIVATKPGFGQGRQPDLDLSKPAPILLILGTSATGTIRGSLAGASGAGWMMAIVHASSESGESATAQVGRDGKFVIENVAAGEVTVTGMLMSMKRQSSTEDVKVIVPNGGEVEVQLTAKAGDVTVRGNVKSGGQPLPATHVTFSSSGQGQWSTQTEADGSYEVTGLEPGHYNVAVMRYTGTGYVMETELTSSTTLDIDASFVQITGRVIDDRGAGVEGASVSAHAAKERADGTTTDTSGAFMLTVQADRAHRIAANRKGFAIATTEAPAGSVGPLVLQLHHTAGAHVRLVDSQSGKTLNGYVVVRDESGKIQFPTSGDREEDGSLLLPLPEGSYRVSASAGDYASQTIKLSVPSGETTIALSRGGTLVVSSRDDADELIKLVMPNGEEYVRCYCNGIAEIRLAGKTTKVDHVAAGAYRMQVIDEHEVIKRTYSIVITEGQTTTVDATK